jgi:hypothetical protein
VVVGATVVGATVGGAVGGGTVGGGTDVVNAGTVLGDDRTVVVVTGA